MKKFVLQSVFFGLAALLLCIALDVAAPARTNGGSSNVVIVIEEHPWDVLKNAVKIEVLFMNDENVVLLVWFNLEDPPVIVQMDRDDYDRGPYASHKRMIKKILSIFLE